MRVSISITCSTNRMSGNRPRITVQALVNRTKAISTVEIIDMAVDKRIRPDEAAVAIHFDMSTYARIHSVEQAASET